MIKEITRVAKHTATYGVGVVLSKAVGFLMLPVYTHFLKPADYGTLELLDLIVFLAGNIAALGISRAVFRFYAAYEDEHDRKEVVSTAMLFSAGMFALAAAAMILLAPTIAALVFGSRDYALFVRIVSLTLFFTAISDVPMAYWQAQERTTLFVVLGFLRSIVGATLIVTALVILRRGVLGVVWANLATSALFGLGTAVVVLVQVRPRLVKEKLKEMLSYGMPLVPWSLTMFVLTFSDRFFLRRFGGLADVGVYSLGYKLSMIVPLLVTGPFAQLWQWHQFELAKHEDGKNLFARIQLYVTLASVFVALGVSLFACDIVKVIAPSSYVSASRIVPLITLTYVIENIRSFATSGILVQKETRRLIRISIVVSSATLVLNYFLISRFLAMGAAVATLLAYALALGLCYRAAQKVYAIRYDYRRNGLIFGVAALFYLIAQRIDLSIVLSGLANGGLLLLFALFAFWLLDREERSMFQQIGAKFALRMKTLVARGAQGG
jgi:O-antigen/teichoic acid export membrane protein